MMSLHASHSVSQLEKASKHLHEANIDREALYERSKKVRKTALHSWHAERSPTEHNEPDSHEFSSSTVQLMETNSAQREKIMKLTESINELLVRSSALCPSLSLSLTQ